jgi:2',3'-cyclic-nucleotide 2'-phosphodiesterase / 3'-nucleotidase / 5'-nucleotidase
MFLLDVLEPRRLLAGIQLSVLSTHEGGTTAEIVAHDPRTQRLFATSAADDLLTILDVADPANPTVYGVVDLSALGSPNSVAVRDGVVAVALDNPGGAFLPGKVAFLKPNGQLITTLDVGATPDMVTFTPDGSALLVANEGEPSSYNQPDSVDGEGSVSVIDFRRGIGHVKDLTQADVRTADFRAFNGGAPAGVRVFGPNATVAQDLEPEYVTVSADSRTAYVTLQENNAIATVELATATVTAITPLGFKNHNLPGNGLDASDSDSNMINIANWPVSGMYQPDAIASYAVGGQTYLVTANEGDAREYAGFVEAARVRTLDLDDAAFPNEAALKANARLGRLNVTTKLGDTDGDGDFDQLYSFGARSFSVWTDGGTLVSDSGDDLERITAAAYPANFNASNNNNTFDNRSDDKGPEPEGVALGTIDGRTYAFVTLERIGGVVVYDVSNPAAPQFVQYVNNRTFSGTNPAGDLGPEGITFIKGTDSPTGSPLLAVANEISGTVTLYAIDAVAGAAAAAEVPVLTGAIAVGRNPFGRDLLAPDESLLA